MKDKRQDSKTRLEHILKSLNEIERFTRKCSKKKFISDDLLNSAVLFQFSVIGEAIIHVEPHLLNKYDYPWYKIRAFRNFIAHEYFNIKMSSVWNIVVKDLPELKGLIFIILKKEF